VTGFMFGDERLVSNNYGYFFTIKGLWFIQQLWFIDSLSYLIRAVSIIRIESLTTV